MDGRPALAYRGEIRERLSRNCIGAVATLTAADFAAKLVTATCYGDCELDDALMAEAMKLCGSPAPVWRAATAA
jgi:hypothetical protein